jgi:two-component sensor histidine kinase
VRLIGTVRDISERMAQREQIEHLMREVNHRSKNLLSVVQAIARQTAATTDVASFLRTLDERLVSLSASHDLLLAHDWSAVSVRALVLRQLGHVDGAGRRFQIDGGDVAVGPRAAQALGMAIHELATNAMKYGALGTADGVVHISWALVESPDGSRFTLNWTETGGPAVVPPPRAGYGRTVIERMTAMALDGTSMLTFAATGVSWRLDVPARSLSG